MTNTSFPCSIDRIRGPLGASDQMYLINHNLDFGEGSILLPNRFIAAITNGISSCVGSSTLLILLGCITQSFVAFRCGRIVNHANGCAPLGSGRYPNFVLLDWVDVGQASAAADRLNGLS